MIQTSKKHKKPYRLQNTWDPNWYLLLIAYGQCEKFMKKCKSTYQRMNLELESLLLCTFTMPLMIQCHCRSNRNDHFIMFESCKSIFDKTIYLLSPLFFGCSLFVIVSDQDIWLISSFSSFDLVSCSKCLVPKRYIGSYFTLTSKEWVIMKTDVIIDTLYFGFMIPCWCLR